jgi:YbbR domain-containing protein
MKRLLANWELKGLAVLSAILFWFLVIGTENSFYTFPEPIPVKAFNLADDLAVSEELPSVTLRLKIDKRESIKNITVDDFSAFVDLQGQKEGEISVQVEVSAKNPDIAVVKVEPAKINVTIEKMDEKTIPVEYKIEGEVEEGYQVEEVTLSSEEVKIKGAGQVLNELFVATALINLDGYTKDIDTQVSLIAYNNDGEEVDGVVFEEKTVDVSVDIEPRNNQKIVGVQPSIIGKPDDSVWIESINVDPSYLILEGKKSVLDDIEYIATQEIVVDGIVENKTFNVQAAQLPEGVEITEDSIAVSIKVAPYDKVDENMQRKTVTVPLLVKKFKTVQRGSKLDPPSATLIVEGTPENLDNVASSLRLELDISKLSQSGETLKLNENDLALPQGVKVVSLSPQSISVTWD